LQKCFFALKNTIFAKIRSADSKIPYTQLRKSDSTNWHFSRKSAFCKNRRFAKIGLPKICTSVFCCYNPQNPIFAVFAVFAKIGMFLQKLVFTKISFLRKSAFL
jgi:hypothetical protein